MFEDLKNKRILITGASGGIGECLAKKFAHYGAIVGMHYNTNKKQACRSMSLFKNDSKPAIFKADLLEFKEVEKLFNSFMDKFKGIDILINNAGAVLGNADFLEMGEKSWDDTLSLNLKAPFFLAQKAFFCMKKHGSGNIINVSSIAAKYGGSRKSVHYGASKAAIENVTIALAKFGAPFNIRVNCIRPSVIDTPFHTKFKKKNLKERIKLIPLKKMGNPEDVANMALFLASNASDFITGQIFSVTGGE